MKLINLIAAAVCSLALASCHLELFEDGNNAADVRGQLQFTR